MEKAFMVLYYCPKRFTKKFGSLFSWYHPSDRWWTMLRPII